MNGKNENRNRGIKQNLKEKIINFLDKKWFGIGLIVLFSIIIYGSSLNAPFVYDDTVRIVENPDIKQLRNIKTKLIYPYSKEHKLFQRSDPSRPLTYLTFTLNYHFGKLNTFGYHLVNLVIHILTSILIFFLARKILFYTYKKYFNLFPLLVALFFAIHPVNTEVVVNISRRSTSLATFFYLLSLLFFIRTFEKNKILYVFSLLFFILSFFSKQTAVTLPLIVLIFDYIFLSDFNIKKVIQKKYYHMPFWLVLIGFLLFRYLYLGGIGLAMVDPHIKWSSYSYFITQFYVIVRYFVLLTIPIGLCIDHWISPAKTVFEPKILISLFMMIGILILVLTISKKKTNISKIILFSTLWFFITLSPTSSFFPLITGMAERRVYLSGFGFYLMIVFVYFLIFCRDPSCSNRYKKRMLLGFIGIHILLLSVVTVRRNMLFQNPVLLWQDVISNYPDNGRAHINLGVWYKRQKEYDKAFKKFRKAIQLNPHSAKAYYNLGLLYKEQKEYDKAFQAFQKTLVMNPVYLEAYTHLGIIYYLQKDYNKALQEYQKAIELNPNSIDPHINLGIIYYEQKNYNKALQEYQKAIELGADYAELHNNLGALYHKQQDYNKALQEYQKAIELSPNYAEARYNLGALYYSQKEYRKALQEFEVLLKLVPDDRNVKDIIKTLRRLLKEHSNT